MTAAVAEPDSSPSLLSMDPHRPLAELLRDLRSTPKGLTSREAARRRVVYGANRLRRPSGRQWPRELLSQFTQPLAMLLMVAAALAWAGGTPALSLAVIAVIVLNAGFAFFQERQAEQAVDALSSFLPPTARGCGTEPDATSLLPTWSQATSLSSGRETGSVPMPG